MPSLSHASTTFPPAVLDVEASGFGRHSYPIEVGFILPDGHAFCTLVRPQPQWTHWDEGAAALHHISRSLIEQRGQGVHDVATLLNAELRGHTVYSDGWANDYSWLAILFDAADMTPSFKLDNLRALLTEQDSERWHQVKDQVSTELGCQRHRASTDARILQMTLKRLHTGA